MLHQIMDKGITADVTVIVPTVHHTTAIDTAVGIMVMTMYTVVSLVAIKVAAVWIKRRDCCYGILF